METGLQTRTGETPGLGSEGRLATEGHSGQYHNDSRSRCRLYNVDTRERVYEELGEAPGVTGFLLLTSNNARRKNRWTKVDMGGWLVLSLIGFHRIKITQEKKGKGPPRKSTYRSHNSPTDSCLGNRNATEGPGEREAQAEAIRSQQQL